MTDFTATHFRFEVEALTPLSLDEYTGSTLRGALVQALQNNFCPDRSQADAEHQAICPVCWLLSHESSPGDSRRPYAVEPLLGDRRIFNPGERFQFGLTLFGQAVNLFPYLVLAIPQMGKTGMGHKLDDGRGRWRRGQFVLRQIEEVNPIAQTHSTLMGENQQMVRTPSSLVTDAQVSELSSQLAQRLAMQERPAGHPLSDANADHLRQATRAQAALSPAVPTPRRAGLRASANLWQRHRRAACVERPACAGRSGRLGRGHDSLVGPARPFEPARPSSGDRWLHRRGMVPGRGRDLGAAVTLARVGHEHPCRQKRSQGQRMVHRRCCKRSIVAGRLETREVDPWAP